MNAAKPDREVITTIEAPSAIGPYSQALRHGSMLFVCGQLGVDPATGSLVEGGMKAQTHQALGNLARLLAAAGSNLAAVAKVTVYLADMRLFAEMNAVYTEHFLAPYPVRTTVGVKDLPLGALVEIDATMVVP